MSASDREWENLFRRVNRDLTKKGGLYLEEVVPLTPENYIYYVQQIRNLTEGGKVPLKLPECIRIARVICNCPAKRSQS